MRRARQQRQATSSRKRRRRGRLPALVAYQRRYIDDTSHRKLFVKARRIGGSFVVALDAAMDAAGVRWAPDGKLSYHPGLGRDQHLISASHRQSKELLAEVLDHLESFEVALGRPLLAGEPSAERITLESGVRLNALAPNPRTIRGAEGDVTLDEYAHMPRPDEVWAAAKSVTDPNLGHPDGYKLRVVSTPFGDDNKFYRLCETDEGKRFSRHRVDIYDALEDGFPADIEALREEAGDADAFAEEYECVFLSAKARYISAALWDAACYDLEDRPEGDGIGYAGYDVARKATGDLVAACELRRIAGVLWQDAECWTDRGVDWDAQEAKAAEILERCERLGVDATSIGSQFAERLQKRFGARVDAVEFTPKSKEELATGLRLALERGKLRPLGYDTGLRTAVLSIRREVTAAGNVRYDAPRTKAGHADQGWALALAVKVAGDGPGDFDFASEPTNETGGDDLDTYF